MRYFWNFVFVLTLLLLPINTVSAQHSQGVKIPSKALFYDSKGRRISSLQHAFFYRILGKNKAGVKYFRDYYISGELKAEKHYVTLGTTDDRQTVLTGLCRTFYRSGKPESIMQYVNGKASGRAISFFRNGTVGMKLNYRNGVLHGPTYSYNERGKLEYTTVWDNGKLVSEKPGGRDSYIDKKTGVDMFVARYTADDGLIEAKARDIAGKEGRGNATPERKKQPGAKPDVAVAGQEKPAKAMENDADKGGSDADKLPDTQELIAEIKYPDGNKAPQSTAKDKPKATKATFLAGLKAAYKKDVSKEFSFPYLYKVISDAAFQTNEVSFYDNIAMNYDLNIAQTVPGYAGQKELIYHYNMDYDEVASADRVTGENPRQMGFWGPTAGNKLTARRISLFTWSKAEMLHIAIDAIGMGFKVLGGYDTAKLDGNFILEPEDKSAVAQVMISFVHKPNLYAGLYHIQIEVR